MDHLNEMMGPKDANGLGFQTRPRSALTGRPDWLHLRVERRQREDGGSRMRCVQGQRCNSPGKLVEYRTGI